MKSQLTKYMYFSYLSRGKTALPLALAAREANENASPVSNLKKRNFAQNRNAELNQDKNNCGQNEEQQPHEKNTNGEWDTEQKRKKNREATGSSCGNHEKSKKLFFPIAFSLTSLCRCAHALWLVRSFRSLLPWFFVPFHSRASQNNLYLTYFLWGKCPNDKHSNPKLITLFICHLVLFWRGQRLWNEHTIYEQILLSAPFDGLSNYNNAKWINEERWL